MRKNIFNSRQRLKNGVKLCMNGLIVIASNAPPLSDYAVSRESIYTREDEML